MKRLSELLSRFRNLTPPEGAVKEIVQKVVKEVVGITLLPDEIVVARERIHLRIDSIRRSEIMLVKGTLLRKIAEELPGKRVVREIV